MENTTTTFGQALTDWLFKAQTIVNNERMGRQLEVRKGRKYTKIVIHSNQESAFCFIENSTGNVLKAATWSAPAKKARGNIYTEHVGVCAYGAHYIIR